MCTDAITSAGIGKVKEVRGKGLFIGVELDCEGGDIVAECMACGLIINCTQQTVLRLAPAIVIGQADLDAGMEILLDVLKG